MLKAGNIEQETSLRAFYCNYNLTCSISAHAQTLTNIRVLKIHSNIKITNEYPNGANIRCSPTINNICKKYNTYKNTMKSASSFSQIFANTDTQYEYHTLTPTVRGKDNNFLLE